MLTFTPGTYCRMAESFETHLHTRRTFGRGAGLCVLLVQAGSCTAEGTSGPRILGAGSVAVFGGQMQLAPVAKAEVVGVVLEGIAPKAFQCDLGAPLIVNAANTKELEEVLLRLRGCAGKGQAQESAAGYALVCQLACIRPGDAPPLVLAAIEQIREHFAEVYGVEELADELMVSKSHLIRQFSAATGMPPGKYLAWVRLEAAQKYLLMGGLLLEAIAGLCGFSSGNYLCRMFKKEYGQTPAAWARQNRVSRLPGPADEKMQSLFL